MDQDARLFAITEHLTRAQAPLTAARLAEDLEVSARTIYRDMDRLRAAGVPVAGTQRSGYVIARHVQLAPLTLTPRELEALNLGLAVAAELADPALAEAVQSLTGKIDAAQPSQPLPAEVHAGPSPYTVPAQGFAHLAPVRAAIAARQKLHLTYTDDDGAITRPKVRPLELSFWKRIWVLTCWSETENSFARYRLDQIESLEPLAELFADERGKRLQDAPGS